MKSCCLDEANRTLKRHRDIATCDGCGRLLLAYENDLDYESAVDELARHGVAFETGTTGKLKVVAKDRRT
jgi:hypothetical protein